MSEENLRKLVGNRIALARQAAGLKQDELSVAVGVHKQTISRWERGEATPNAGQLVSIVEAVGCTCDFLLGLSDSLTVHK